MNFQELISKAPNVTAVDIGASGSLVTLCKGFNISICEMPGGAETECNHLKFSTCGPIYAEDVHTFPGQGVVSMGSLMQRKGRIEAIGYCTHRKVNWIQPIAWIECFTLKRSKNFKNKREWKKHLIDIAIEQTGIETLNLKTADAVLIWIWAAHKELGHSLTKVGSKIWG